MLVGVSNLTQTNLLSQCTGYTTYYSRVERHELKFELGFFYFFFNFFLCHDFACKLMHAYNSLIIPGLPLFPRSTQYLFDFGFLGMT